VEDYYLEQIVGSITGQYKVPFGDAVISTRDTCLGLETCEELFTPNRPPPLPTVLLVLRSSPILPEATTNFGSLTHEST
jgi:hypothetical protein